MRSAASATMRVVAGVHVHGQAVDVIDLGIEPDAEPREPGAGRERGAHAEHGADAADDHALEHEDAQDRAVARRRAP